jgi:segregation and condensation protein B
MSGPKKSGSAADGDPTDHPGDASLVEQDSIAQSELVAPGAGEGVGVESELTRPTGDDPDTVPEVLETGDAVVETGEAVDSAPEAVTDTTESVNETGDAVSETAGQSNGLGAERSEAIDAAAAHDVPPVNGDMLSALIGPDTSEAVTDPDAEKPRMDLAQLKAIVEALIFASPEPLTPKMLLKLLNDEPKEDVLAVVEALKQDYQAQPGLHVAEVAGGYQITTRPELHEWVRRLFHERTTQKLSVPSLETLSVIAYKQPITQAEVGEIRGVNTSGVLTTLLERHLIKIVGRKNVIGRPFLYGTTREFLIRFGLKDVNDLPRIEDVAQQLGFEPPAILKEQNVSEEMLPLDEEPGGSGPGQDEEPSPEG